jgi:hypothetical protein
VPAAAAASQAPKSQPEPISEVSQGWIATYEWTSVPELLSLHCRRYFLSFRVLTLIKAVFQLLVCPIGGFSPGSGGVCGAADGACGPADPVLSSG